MFLIDYLMAPVLHEIDELLLNFEMLIRDKSIHYYILTKITSHFEIYDWIFLYNFKSFKTFSFRIHKSLK